MLGESPRVDAWVLAGALVVPVAGDDDTRQAWASLPDDVEVVVLTPEAAAVLAERAEDRLSVVLP